VPAYEAAGWEPPAPVVRATVRGARGTIALEVPMLIDSGADVSVIPDVVARAVGAEMTTSRTPVAFHSGAEEEWEGAQLTLEFDRYRFDGLFLIAEVDYGVIGRNILNLLTLTLDGPRRIWSFESPPA
jgi:hypothetical protein